MSYYFRECSVRRDSKKGKEYYKYVNVRRNESISIKKSKDYNIVNIQFIL